MAIKKLVLVVGLLGGMGSETLAVNCRHKTSDKKFEIKMNQLTRKLKKLTLKMTHAAQVKSDSDLKKLKRDVFRHAQEFKDITEKLINLSKEWLEHPNTKDEVLKKELKKNLQMYQNKFKSLSEIKS